MKDNQQYSYTKGVNAWNKIVLDKLIVYQLV
jgi:hypothetical protein